jgi:hypothetical protein
MDKTRCCNILKKFDYIRSTKACNIQSSALYIHGPSIKFAQSFFHSSSPGLSDKAQKMFKYILVNLFFVASTFRLSPLIIRGTQSGQVWHFVLCQEQSFCQFGRGRLLWHPLMIYTFSSHPLIYRLAFLLG